ncbi:MAG: tRNA (adenine(22)-N(1))-methyltransferase [Anaerovoracaceae bacterium]|jgi:tRNA (adenine22-N1)-methyltransferase
MVRLSERLEIIASCITKGDRVADIGTDHGFLPIYLYQKELCSQIVLCDINKGPLDKARENISKHLPGEKMDLRLGDGLDPVRLGECNCAIIAGMGGRLIISILEKNLEKALSFDKLILQPRNGQVELREWLIVNHFSIRDELLAQEGNYICEIIVATGKPGEGIVEFPDVPEEIKKLSREISPLLFIKKDSYLPDLIRQKIRIDRDIMDEISRGGGGEDRLPMVIEHRNLLERLLEMEV